MFLYFAALGLFVLYALLILYYYRHWKKVPGFLADDHPQVPVSLVIPARNEASNLPHLLRALEQQTYPAHLFEIIVVDDFSTDATAGIVSSSSLPNIKLIRPDGLPEDSSKKKAIATGIAVAKGELIVTTDADCIPEQRWLQAITSFYEKKNASFIAAPVHYRPGKSWLHIFQSLDFLTLQGITAASVNADFHTMCNGANLAYTKEAFLKVGGFEGIDKKASGDDMLLMHKIRALDPARIFYLKSPQAVVTTDPMPNLKSFLAQRRRWASKTFVYQDYRIIAALGIVFLFNLLFPVLLIAAFFRPFYGWVFMGLWIWKTLLETPFVRSVARFYGDEKLLRYFFLFQPLHILYTVSIGIISQFGAYEWKGRKTK
jgi:cellulose synthase/poly-beta-1,6-N-acetylglucosamine synthase-like glycosyltransferase